MFGKFDDDGGGFDARGGERTRFETEFVGGLAAHQRDDVERTGLQFDLGHHPVFRHLGDDAGEAVAELTSYI